MRKRRPWSLLRDVSALFIVAVGAYAEHGASEGLAFTELWVGLADTQGEPGVEHRTASAESAEFSPDGRWIIAGSKGVMDGDGVRRGQRVTLWSTAGELLWTRDRADEVEAVAFSPDGTHFAAGGEDRLVEVFSFLPHPTADHPGEPRLVATLRHDASIDGLRFSHDGRYLATGDEARQIHLWDTHTWRRAVSALHGGNQPWMAVNQIDFTADDRTVFSAGGNGRVVVWSLEHNDHGEPQLTRTAELNAQGGSVKCVRVSPDERLLAAGTKGGLHLWRRDGTASAFVPTGPLADTPDALVTVETVEFHPNGRYLLAGSTVGKDDHGGNGFILVFPLDAFFADTPPQPQRVPTFRQEYLHFNADGSRLVSGHEDGTIRFWSVLSR